jgi:hypothetical protein
MVKNPITDLKTDTKYVIQYGTTCRAAAEDD